MSGRTIVITGASSGIGAEAARQLTERNEKVVLVGRNPQRTADTARPIGADYFLADFNHLDQVRELARQLDERYERIDVLINNAGASAPRRRVTADGYEQDLQVNYLAPFLLTNLLMPRLARSQATVITTASVGHRFARLDLDDLQLEKGWGVMRAYANSKLLDILFTRQLQRRFGDLGVSAISFHPGIVASGFAHDVGGWLGWWYRSRLGRMLMTKPAAAAEDMVFLAEGTPGEDWVPGEYYVGRKRAGTSSQARNRKLAERVWAMTAEMLDIEA
ncbi:SDR family NAD(P)-dependent oxidoreductase [Propionibacterium australiense]|uniref:SDR family NAD(P)-dependent oxidoreductase n=1 Tax=Propionibacterium australiense TaxID=119981 RepID=A0A383S4W1_9ACTN|nr:SDR family NAD(P)-dependent oxidoreductase [Propionibacterium australiense]RLP08150.1 SDR family NAD(P)-dependent oxidoreductase [Propionibacterium australiense]RLP08321.1 SDR family NAD(P)-dependent oxidoreductase [Propionibacterium australiense]SYZ33058.1 short chain dehydrogenase [Propionibacterium australiense]VEH89036.1 Rhamnolipids biosynthesis 3-oxoacyl-[acyl-carrier-protein] reductase [Propionibacterium australiense]